MTKPIKVLHLEDKFADAELIKREMRVFPVPFEWLWVSNRSDFEKALDLYLPDIVISDHSLQNFTSIDAFEILKKSKLNIPFILVTATMSEEFAVDMMKIGITDYLLKDRLQRLPVAVANALERWEGEKEKASYLDEIAKSEANLTAIIENTDVNIYSLDDNFKYITFNSLLKNTLKQVYDLDIKVGDDVFGFLNKLDPAEAKEWEMRYTQALAGKSIQFVKKFKVGDQMIFTSFSINPIREGEKVTGLSCFAWDITAEKIADLERKASELDRNKMSADLIQRNKDLEQFAYIVSHNLRAPLANILGISSILDHAIQESDKLEAIAGITLSARKLDEVVIDLNNILQAKREMSENTEMIYFQDLVDNIQSSIYHLVQKNAATIVTDFSDVEGIQTIKSFLYSIFYNLISNSLKYRQRTIVPVIKISSSTSNGKTLLTFSDNGLGIDLTIHGDKIFGLYKRFHLETEGKGMGLFMVKTHVESLGGSIMVRSELGKGAEFTITL